MDSQGPGRAKAGTVDLALHGARLMHGTSKRPQNPSKSTSAPSYLRDIGLQFPHLWNGNVDLTVLEGLRLASWWAEWGGGRCPGRGRAVVGTREALRANSWKA